MTQAWKQWEGQLIDGAFPLDKYLGGWEESAMFLTECHNQELPKAAIKLIPSSPETSEPQLARWKQAAQLFHPHLIRIFNMGSCQLDGKELLYVIMEYAEDDLSHLLANRPLATTEAKEMLEPVLEALAYVHEKGFLCGCLKPSNIMAVNGRLKISSDGLCRVSELPLRMEKRSIYDPPELAEGGGSPAGDIWSLGVTLVEALTQQPLNWEAAQVGEPFVPETVPLPFRDFAVRCLRREPQSRWTVADFAAALNDAPSPATNLAPMNTAQTAASMRRYIGPALAGGVLLTAILVAPGIFNGQPELEQNSPISGEQPRVQSETMPAVAQPAKQASSSASDPIPGKAANRVLPTVPQSARDTIHGTVRVAVRVRVDQTGSVTGAEIESPGPSQYFARLALRASQLWEFVPPKVNRQDVRSEWILKFGFTRTTTEVDPIQAVP